MTRIAQLLLVVAALGLWGASRLPWVVATSFDGLGQPKSTTFNGASWSAALVPLALLILAATLAVLAVRGWALRLLAVLVAAATVGMGYLGIGFWVIRDAAVRTAAADLAQVPLAGLATQRHYWGAGLVLVSAVCALAGAVLLVRSATKAGSRPAKTPGKYLAPAARRAAARREPPDDGMSERMIWDALDEGRDPTLKDNEGR
jgi:uncharacterized membrane protein (TIGR02234 family)